MDLGYFNIDNVSEGTSLQYTLQPNLFQDDNRITTAAKDLLCFDVYKKSGNDLRQHITKLNSLLSKVVLLLTEKNCLCKNLEKQIMVLALQSNSLRNLVTVTKDLLSVRNKEVEQLYKELKFMEKNIHIENNKHETLLMNMSESARLNKDIKEQYDSQVKMFNDLRATYEEKVTLLQAENREMFEWFTKRERQCAVKQTGIRGKSEESEACEDCLRGSTGENCVLETTESKQSDEVFKKIKQSQIPQRTKNGSSGDQISSHEWVTNSENGFVDNTVRKLSRLCSEENKKDRKIAQNGYGDNRLYVCSAYPVSNDEEISVINNKITHRENS